MFDCPNCGEPVEDDATFCPHCGSDAETGWKPDVDYYSLELPGEDETDEEPPAYPDETTLRVRNLLGPGALVLCFVLFVSVGYRRYELWMLLPAALLVVAMTLVFLKTHGKARE